MNINGIFWYRCSTNPIKLVQASYKVNSQFQSAIRDKEVAES